MLDNLERIDLSAKDIELIEAALHTQKKILSVQSEAGGTGARQKLSDLKHLLRRVGRARSRKNDMPTSGLMAMVRSFWTVQPRCPECR